MLNKINALLTLTTTMTGGKRELKARIRSIGKAQRTLAAVAALVVLIMAATALVACSEAEAPRETPAVSGESAEAPAASAEPTAAPAPEAAPTPAPTASASTFDRTDPTAVAEAFLTAYFDKMCALDTDLGWEDASQTQLNGLLSYHASYYNDVVLLRQWIAHKAYLAEDGYDVERDMGRFESLEVLSFGIADTLVPGVDSELRGYFKTTAFGTLVQLEMSRDDAGNYAIVNARFPDWKEYNSFCADFTAYMELNDYKDYNKSMYIDHLREEKNKLILEREAWKSGERFCEPFAVHRSFIELTYYGAQLNSNGAEQIVSMSQSNVGQDRFVRKDTHGAAELWVTRTERGTLGDDVDLIQHSADNYDWGDRLLYGAAEYDPQSFFSADTPVTRLVRRSAISENGKSAFTMYYAQFLYEGADVVLTFRFHNATNVDGEWRLYQSEEDCEAWMKTLTFSLPSDGSNNINSNDSLLSLIGVFGVIDSYTVIQNVSGASEPVRTTVSDGDRVNTILDVLSQKALKITEYGGSSGYSVMLILYSDNTPICTIKPVDKRRLSVSFDGKSYIVEYSTNISRTLVDALM